MTKEIRKCSFTCEHYTNLRRPYEDIGVCTHYVTTERIKPVNSGLLQLVEKGDDCCYKLNKPEFSKLRNPASISPPWCKCEERGFASYEHKAEEDAEKAY